MVKTIMMNTTNSMMQTVPNQTTPKRTFAQADDILPPILGQIKASPLPSLKGPVTSTIS